MCVQAMAVVADITEWEIYEDRMWQLYDYFEEMADEAVEEQEDCETYFLLAFDS